MYRGTTPTLTFKVNNLSDFSTIKEVWFTIKDKDNILINKTYTKGEIEIDTEEKTISIDLTQAETLKFTEPMVLVQIKIGFADDKVSVSPVFGLRVKDILNPDEMDNLTAAGSEEIGGSV